MIPPTEIPPDLKHIVDWWMDLRAGVSEISYQEMAAWAQMTGNDPSGFELDAIRAIDAGFRARQHEIELARRERRTQR